MESKVVNSSDTSGAVESIGKPQAIEQKDLAFIPELKDKEILMEGLLTQRLQVHEQHDILIPLKIMLNWLGYGGIDVSTIFGTFAEERVKSFQKDHDLPVSGCIDNITISKVNKLFQASINDRSQKLKSIRNLKRDLNRIGFGGILVSDKMGPFTVNRLKAFQDFYGLPATGKVSVDTLKKINEITSSVLQVGKRSQEIIVLKKYLNLLGHSDLKPTNKFGKYMEKSVKKFQKTHKLPASGIVDEITKIKIYEVFCAMVNKPNGRNKSIRYIKKTLNRIGFGRIVVSQVLGEFARHQIKNFQQFYGLPITGQINGETLNKINEIIASPMQINKQHKDVLLLKENLTSLGYGRISRTKKFGALTEQKVKQFQRDHDMPPSGIADKLTFEKIEQATRYKEKKTYNYYDITLDEVLSIQKGNATMEAHLNPNNLVKDDMGKFQLLDLSRPRVVTHQVLRKYLKKNGILKGKEQAFIDAGKAWGVNEILLVSHASLEVERSSSAIAHGVPVDKNGRITYVEKQNNSMKKPGTTSETQQFVYNVFGVKANSGSELSSKVKKAFDEGWNTPEKSIVGGAKYIKEMYLINGKNTLYYMRWNPTCMVKKGTFEQDIIDKEWLSEQIARLHSIYRQLDSYVLYLEIPIFKGNALIGDHGRRRQNR